MRRRPRPTVAQGSLSPKWPALGLLILALLAGCGPYPTPVPPPQVELRGTVGDTMSPASVRGQKLLSILVRSLYDDLPSDTPPQKRGLWPESGASPVFEFVAAILSDGMLYYTDLPHSPSPPPSSAAGKLQMSELQVKSRCGTIDNAYRFTPSLDVLCSLDSGYVVEVSGGEATSRTVIPPVYHAGLHHPFSRLGFRREQAPTGAAGIWHYAAAELNGRPGASGETGYHGADGEDGAPAQALGQDGGNGGAGGRGGAGFDGAPGSAAASPGAQGADGEPGTFGGDGGRGGNGAAGAPGGDAGVGERGRRGNNGPDLEVQIRPIFSPFYPMAELVYVSAEATWRDGSGRVQQREFRNYIFQLGEPFVIRSVGGKGGAGGDGGAGGRGGHGGAGGDGGEGGPGGRGGDGGAGGPSGGGVGHGRQGNGGDGGDGGNGGNGGHGADGAIGGMGGDGGDGGRGGDGGDIRILYVGSDSFVDRARATIAVETVAGEGGEGGAPGANGISGSGGRGGYAGSGGRGGTGGAGYSAGRNGREGQRGRDGVSGQSATPVQNSASWGRIGPPGRPGRIHAQQRSQ